MPSSIEREKARHSHFLSHEDVLLFGEKHLNKKGKISLILPIEEANKCIENCINHGLYLNRKCNVYPKAHKKSHRILLEIGKKEVNIVEQSIIIENKERHHYTSEYKALTKDFYTIF